MAGVADRRVGLTAGAVAGGEGEGTMGLTVFTFYFVALLVLLGIEGFTGWSGALLVAMIAVLGTTAIAAAIRIVRRG